MVQRFPHRIGRAYRYTEANMHAVRRVLTLLGVGLPLEDFLAIADPQLATADHLADEAVEAWERHVISRIRAHDLAPEEEARRTVASLRLLVAAISELVAYNVERAVFNAAQAHVAVHDAPAVRDAVEREVLRRHPDAAARQGRARQARLSHPAALPGRISPDPGPQAESAPAPVRSPSGAVAWWTGDMGFYENKVLPHAIDLLLGGKSMGKLRARALEGLSGTVLEVGFGSGTNVPYYPAEVDKVYALDPATEGRKIAAKRLAASPVDVEFLDLTDGRLPLDDDSVDHALSTWTLCTIPDVEGALAEMHRVVKPGGKVFFLEHGLSDNPKVARRQHRFDGVQGKIAGGCHLVRDPVKLLEAAGFADIDSTTFTIAGPKILSFMYAGTATKDAVADSSGRPVRPPYRSLRPISRRSRSSLPPLNPLSAATHWSDEAPRRSRPSVVLATAPQPEILDDHGRVVRAVGEQDLDRVPRYPGAGGVGGGGQAGPSGRAVSFASRAWSEIVTGEQQDQLDRVVADGRVGRREVDQRRGEIRAALGRRRHGRSGGRAAGRRGGAGERWSALRWSSTAGLSDRRDPGSSSRVDRRGSRRAGRAEGQQAIAGEEGRVVRRIVPGCDDRTAGRSTCLSGGSPVRARDRTPRGVPSLQRATSPPTPAARACRRHAARRAWRVVLTVDAPTWLPRGAPRAPDSSLGPPTPAGIFGRSDRAWPSTRLGSHHHTASGNGPPVTRGAVVLGVVDVPAAAGLSPVKRRRRTQVEALVEGHLGAGVEAERGRSEGLAVDETGVGVHDDARTHHRGISASAPQAPARHQLSGAPGRAGVDERHEEQGRRRRRACCGGRRRGGVDGGGASGGRGGDELAAGDGRHLARLGAERPRRAGRSTWSVAGRVGRVSHRRLLRDRCRAARRGRRGPGGGSP